MTSYYWAKISISILDERRIASLPDSSWRRYHECILLAKEADEGGYLPSVADMAWRLRLEEESLRADLSRLATAELLELRETGEGELWYVTGFEESQGAMSGNERVRLHRQSARQATTKKPPVTEVKQSSNDDVTIRYTEKRREEKREEKNAHARTPRPAPAAPPPSSKPIVRNEPKDRSPGGMGYELPSEPPRPDKAEQPPETRAIGEMANALTDVTGVSARLNWQRVGGLAEDLYQAGYTAAQILAAYGRQPTAGWHWYTNDWRGRKGDRPTPENVRETIAGATAPTVPITAVRKPNAIQRALAAFGPAPQTGESIA